MGIIGGTNIIHQGFITKFSNYFPEKRYICTIFNPIYRTDNITAYDQMRAK